MTAAQADRFCSAVGSRIPRDEDQPGLPGGPRTALRWQFDEDTGEMSMSIHLPPADGDRRPDEFKVPSATWPKRSSR